MKNLRSLLGFSVLAFVSAAAAHATTINLFPPSNGSGGTVAAKSNPEYAIGAGNVGVEFQASSAFSTGSVGIDFNAFGNQFGPASSHLFELDAYIYAVSGFGTTGYGNEGTQGSLLGSGALCGDGSSGLVGSCSSSALFGYNLTGDATFGTPTFHDVPLDFLFASGNYYRLEFNVNNGAGWGQTPGSGGDAKANMMIFGWDPPSGTGAPAGTTFAAGPTVVIDGLFNNNLSSDNFPATRLTTGTVPEPASLSLIGCGLIGLALLKRKLVVGK